MEWKRSLNLVTSGQTIARAQQVVRVGGRLWLIMAVISLLRFVLFPIFGPGHIPSILHYTVQGEKQGDTLITCNSVRTVT